MCNIKLELDTKITDLETSHDNIENFKKTEIEKNHKIEQLEKISLDYDQLKTIHLKIERELKQQKACNNKILLEINSIRSDLDDEKNKNLLKAKENKKLKQNIKVIAYYR